MENTDRPLNAKEASLWLFQVMNPEAVVHVPMAFRTTGRTLRWWPMKVAVDTLVEMHPSLRTVFADVDGAPVRRVLDPSEVDIDVDIIATTADTLMDDIGAFARRPFRFTEEPLIRVGHFVGDPAGDVVCFTSHHLICDAQSNAMLLRTFMEVYDAAAAEQPVPEALSRPVESFTEPPASESDIQFWREHLAGAEKTARPLSIAEPDHGDDYRGSQMVQPIPSATVAQLAAVAKELNSSPHVVLLSVFYLLLTNHGAGEDVVVGMPLDARTAAARDTVGYHVNIVGLRGVIDLTMSFRDWAKHVREQFLTGLRHVRASIDEAMPGSYDSASDWREPLFRYMFNYSPYSSDWTTRYRITVLPVRTAYSRLDLTLNVIPRGEDMLVQVIYRESVYPVVAVERFIDRFSALLASCVTDLDRPLADHSLWSEADRSLGSEADRSLGSEADREVRASGPADQPDLAEVAPGAMLSVRDPYGRELPPGVWGELHADDRALGRQARWAWAGGLETPAEPAEPRSPAPTPVETAVTGDPEVVTMLIGLWRDLLDKDDVKGDTHFFRSGGTSIKAARVVASIKKNLGVKIKLRQVFATPTPAELAAAIATTGS
ncbi:condensation domain-containing protein [Krasilnikovia sp. M28-CT-15]|uniref:condensation domain-containing protein n=1 Tax=Krasilnikovia sp. M28-CT-15 TaxID=3373540 RepID=UPI00399C8582